MSDFPLDASQYEILHKIGSTQFSEAFAARCLPQNKLVCIKKFDLEICPFDIAQFRSEISFWASMFHNNAILYYGSFTIESKLWMITEFVDGGSLKEILTEFFPMGIVAEDVIASILQKVLSFLDYFHSQKQIHRDLRTKNILLSMNGEVKVGGFWKASSLMKSGILLSRRNTALEMSGYNAPETLIESKGYKESADIWSLGIIAYELATGKLPFQTDNPITLIDRIVKGPPPRLPDSFSSPFRDFVKHCLKTKPEKRATAHELLKHKFIAKAKDANCIEANLMHSLPPLIQRVDLHDQENKEKLEKELHIIFNFGEEDQSNEVSKEQIPKSTELKPPPIDSTKVTKKGRFTLSVNPNVNNL